MQPKIGQMFIGCQRFRKLGSGCRQGDYETRRGGFVDDLRRHLEPLAENVFPGVVYDRVGAERALDAFRQARVDGVLCVFLSWAEDDAWIAFLREVGDLPLICFTPVPGRVSYADTRDENDFVEFLAQGGLVGSLVGSGSIARLHRRAEVIVDEVETALPRLGACFRAAHVRARLRRARFGLVAAYNEIMRGTYMDPYTFSTQIGPELRFISYEQLRLAVARVDDDAATVWMNELAEQYTVEPDVDRGLFLESVRASLGLAALRNEQALDALVLNDVSPELFETIGLRPGFYPPDFHRHGAVLTPEGDLGAGLIMYILHQLTGGAVNYIEPFYIEKDRGTFAGGHAGPHDYTDPRYRHLVRVSRDVRFAKTKYRFAGAPFAWYRIPPGRKTVAHLSEADGRRKLVCFMAESLAGEHALCSYNHTDFRPDTPVTELFEKILSTGTTQHFAVVEGDVRAELAILARMTDFDFHAC